MLYLCCESLLQNSLLFKDRSLRIRRKDTPVHSSLYLSLGADEEALKLSDRSLRSSPCSLVCFSPNTFICLLQELLAFLLNCETPKGPLFWVILKFFPVTSRTQLHSNRVPRFRGDSSSTQQAKASWISCCQCQSLRLWGTLESIQLKQSPQRLKTSYRKEMYGCNKCRKPLS